MSWDAVGNWIADNADLLGAGAGALVGAIGTEDQTTSVKPYHYPGQKEGVSNFINAAKT